MNGYENIKNEKNVIMEDYREHFVDKVFHLVLCEEGKEIINFVLLYIKRIEVDIIQDYLNHEISF